MRVAIVGTGLMARVRARHLLADQRVSWVGLASAQRDRAAAVANELGAGWGGSVEDALSLGVDAVMVAGASDCHATHVRMTFPLRIPVFCEKPLATDLGECQKLVEDAAEEGVDLQVGFQRRFDPELLHARQMFEDGEIGRLYSVRLTSHDHEPPPEQFVATSGGLFADLGVHDFDLARWLTGEEAVEVHVIGTCRSEWTYFEKHGDIDTAATLLRMESGMPVSISTSRHSPDGHDVRAELFGARHNVATGYGDFTPLRTPQQARDGRRIASVPNFLKRFEVAFQDQTEAFVSWVQGDIPNPCPASDGLASLRMAAAARRSHEAGRPVRLAEISPSQR